MPGQRVPTWDEVVSQPWVPWDEVRDGPRALVATQDAGAALTAVMALTPGL